MHSVFYLFFEFLLILFADFRSQSIFFQITVQGNTTDIKHSCQFTNIAAGRFPGRNKSVFIIFPGFFKRPVTRQLDIIGFDDCSGSMEECLLDNSLQLFDITGPAAACQKIQRFRRQTFRRQIMLRRHFSQNMGSDDLNIFHALAQRRNTHCRIQYQLI